MKERRRKESEAAHLVSKSTNYPEIPTLPPSPFAALATSTSMLVPSAPHSLAGLLPSALGSPPSHLFALSPPPPSLKTSPWSAPSSPHIHSISSHTSSHIALPSLALEPKQHSHWPTVSPLAQKKCPGSLILWEPGDPATTYPFNLHSFSLEGSATLPWTATIGERPGSLRLRSDDCDGVSGPSQSCCQPCAGIATSTKYQQVEGRAKNDCRHRAYDKLNWEQLVGRTREKSDLLAKERSKV